MNLKGRTGLRGCGWLGPALRGCHASVHKSRNKEIASKCCSSWLLSMYRDIFIYIFILSLLKSELTEITFTILWLAHNKCNRKRSIQFQFSVPVTCFLSTHCGFFFVCFCLDSKKLYMFCNFLSVSHTVAHDCFPKHTHMRAGKRPFPCSGPVLVSLYFLSWLLAVSFFRSHIHPLGMLTSFERGFINSFSFCVPWNVCFHCKGKTLSYFSV